MRRLTHIRIEDITLVVNRTVGVLLLLLLRASPWGSCVCGTDAFT